MLDQPATADMTEKNLRHALGASKHSEASTVSISKKETMFALG
jgi:hypothetical protein